MAFALIVALLVAVITLAYIVRDQSKTIKNYEKELTKKARRSRKSGTK